MRKILSPVVLNLKYMINKQKNAFAQMSSPMIQAMAASLANGQIIGWKKLTLVTAVIMATTMDQDVSSVRAASI